jgi:hypothetical protein
MEELTSYLTVVVFHSSKNITKFETSYPEAGVMFDNSFFDNYFDFV